MAEVMSVQAQERCTWQYLAVDLAAAAFASALVSPWVSAIDKIIYNKAAKGVSLSSSLKSWASKPRAAAGFLFLPFLVYFGTYATANIFDSFHALNNCVDPATTSSTPGKFLATTTISTGLCVLKDGYSAALASKTPVPLLSYALFTARDAVTVFASFNLPTMLAQKLADAPFHDLTPFSSAFKSEESRLRMAQIMTPAAAQVVSTPIHLLGINVHNRQQKIPMRERLDSVRQIMGFATPLRMLRILPSFGVGGVANTGFRKSMMARVI